MSSNLLGRLKALEQSTPRNLLKNARGLPPLVVCHHPQLPETPPEEIEAARSAQRSILHFRVERAPEGQLQARVQREQDPHVVWSREEDAPSTTEAIYNLDDGGSKHVETVAARYGAGCRVLEL